MRLSSVFKFLAALCFAFLLAAQSQMGSIEGTVTDVSGGVIPGAAITMVNESRGAKVEVISNEQGAYRVLGLFPGIYEATVRAPGFQTTVFAAEILPGRRTKQDIVLQIGAITETVTVTSNVPMLQTSVSMMASGPGRGSAANTEEYAYISENKFTQARKQPLSTFSIDVDSASYSNVRRFLHNGELPPADAVRIEEFINYFDYGYPEPGAGEPFSITTEVAACPWKPGNRLLQIGLKSKPIAASELPPGNLVFLLDVSGSMDAGNKLPLLKRSFALLVEQLRPQDCVAIVVYAGAAGVVLPPTWGSQKETIRRALGSLHAAGSTAGAEGIQLAYQIAREAYLPNGINRVILATDGDFNVGISSESELVRLIESKRDEGISLSVLGFGDGNLKDSKMEKLADHGNGNFAYIDSLLEARKAMVEQIGATLLTVAKDVKIQVEFNPAQVESYRLAGYENRLLDDQDFDDDKKDAGDMGAGHTVTAIYEIVPADKVRNKAASDGLRYQETSIRALAKAIGEVAHVKLRYKDPSNSSSKLIERSVPMAETPAEQASEQFRFAAGVTEFAMLLRDSPHKGESSFDSAAALARGLAGSDADGRRAEFVYLVKTARGLAAGKTPFAAPAGSSR